MSPRLEAIKKGIEPVLKKHDVSYAAIFGSYARGEERADSDIDVLIEYKPSVRKSYFELTELEQELSEFLGIKAQVVTKDGLNKHISPYIMNDLKVIYENEV